MEWDLSQETESLNKRTRLFMIGNVVFSLCYFAAAFLFCAAWNKAAILALAFYALIECIACTGYLKFLKRPLNQMINEIKRASQDEYEAQNLRSQAEIFALQSQINPHFLYNTLDMIRSYALSMEADDIAAMTESLSTLFRYSISRPGEMTTFRDELANVKNYLLIQQYRFPDKVEYTVNLEDEDILDYQMPILTIQPIVENAIHHGLEMKIGKGHIKLHAFRTDQKISILISDNGLGMSEKQLASLRRKLDGDEKANEQRPEKRKKGTGIALINVNKRLKFYYGPQYGLVVRSTQNVGTMVEISLPVEDKNQCLP